MSLGYSIAAELCEVFSEENVRNILKKGESLGFIYYEYIAGELNIHSVPLNTAEAIIAIYGSQKEVDMYCITVEMEKTYFNLNFVNDSNQLTVMIPSLNSLWSREYKNKKFDIDIERYMKTFLNLIHDYQIVRLSVEYD